MNGLHDLLATLKKIEEAEAVNLNDPNRDAAGNLPPAQPAVARVSAPETPQEVYDRNDKAKIAKELLAKQVKSKNDLGMVNGYYIEKETGVILHHMIANDRGGQSQGTVVRMDDLSYGEGKKFAETLIYVLGKNALNPERITNPGPFGWKWLEHSYTVIKVNLQDLEKVSRNEPPTMEAPPPVKPVEPVPVKPVEPAPVKPDNGQQIQPQPGDNKGLDRFRELINKAQGIAAEGLKFKSLIGRTLLAELANQSSIIYTPVEKGGYVAPNTNNSLPPAPANDQQVSTGFNGGQTGRMFGNLTPAEIAEGDKLAQAYGDSQDPEIMNLLKQWSDIKNNLLKNSPAPVKPVPDKPVPDKPVPVKPVPDKPDNDQQTIPPEWLNVKIIRANQHAGYGPNGQALYILGDGTPKRTFAYYRQENKTLVPMNINPPREDLKQYQPIPWDTAVKWGTGPQTVTDNKRPGLDPKQGKPEVWDRQKQLQDAGALNTKGKDKGKPLTCDGIEGDNTRAAEKEFGPKIGKTPAPKPENGQQEYAPPPETAKPVEVVKWLSANVPDRKMGEYFWVNGHRWEWHPRTGWKENVPFTWDSSDKDYKRQQAKYTGKEGGPNDQDTVKRESVGYANDELNRIISLVHHR